jgi:hypothetical protein
MTDGLLDLCIPDFKTIHYGISRGPEGMQDRILCALPGPGGETPPEPAGKDARATCLKNFVLRPSQGFGEANANVSENQAPFLLPFN